VTQSAMSALIRQFEESLDVQLFERSPRALRPTRAADEAFVRIQEILAKTDALSLDMHHRGQGVQRFLSFSTSAILAASFVPPVLRAFQDRYPDVKIVMHDAGDSSLIQRVLSEDLEFSIGSYEHEPELLARTTLISDHLCVVCLPDSALARTARLTWRDLVNEPIINMTRGTVQRFISESLAAAGASYRPAFEISLLATAFAMVSHGFGCMVTPAFLAVGNPAANGLVVKKLNEPQIDGHLLVHTRQGHTLSGTATEFLEMMRDYLIQLRKASAACYRGWRKSSN